MNSARRRIAFIAGLLLIGLSSASSLSAGIVSNFEGCNTGTGGSGAQPDGCQGWYTPPVSGTVPASVVTYAWAQAFIDPILGINFAANPTGGNNALGLAGDSDGVERAQLGVPFSQASKWTVSYDLSVLDGSTTASSFPNSLGNIAVFNINQSSGFTVSASWDNSTAGSTWDALYNVYNSANQSLSKSSAGAAWTGLLQNHWYTEWTTFDQSTNRILSVSITDLTTNTTTTVSPAGWYMIGGATPQPAFNALRVTGANNDYANAIMVDNVTLDASVPEPATLALMGMGLLVMAAFRRR